MTSSWSINRGTICLNVNKYPLLFVHFKFAGASQARFNPAPSTQKTLLKDDSIFFTSSYSNLFDACQVCPNTKFIKILSTQPYSLAPDMLENQWRALKTRMILKTRISKKAWAKKWLVELAPRNGKFGQKGENMPPLWRDWRHPEKIQNSNQNVFENRN